jgi:hypothetical protein
MRWRVGLAGVRAATVGVADETQRGLASRRVSDCSRAVSTNSVGICATSCQPLTRREQLLRQMSK